MAWGALLPRYGCRERRAPAVEKCRWVTLSRPPFCQPRICAADWGLKGHSPFDLQARSQPRPQLQPALCETPAVAKQLGKRVPSHQNGTGKQHISTKQQNIGTGFVMASMRFYTEQARSEIQVGTKGRQLTFFDTPAQRNTSFSLRCASDNERWK